MLLIDVHRESGDGSGEDCEARDGYSFFGGELEASHRDGDDYTATTDSTDICQGEENRQDYNPEELTGIDGEDGLVLADVIDADVVGMERTVFTTLTSVSVIIEGLSLVDSIVFHFLGFLIVFFGVWIILVVTVHR